MELHGGAGTTVQQAQSTSVEQVSVLGGQHVPTRLGGEQGAQHLWTGSAAVRWLENFRRDHRRLDTVMQYTCGGGIYMEVLKTVQNFLCSLYKYL